MKRTFGVLMLVAAVSGAGYARQAAPPARTQTIVQQGRAAIANQDFAAGGTLLADYRVQKGITPEWLEALSWMGRGTLAAKKLDEAERYARETYKLAREMRWQDQEGSSICAARQSSRYFWRT